MSGILGVFSAEDNSEDNSIDGFDVFNANNLLVEHNSIDTCFFLRYTNKQFLNDKIFEQYGDYFIIFEGALLNKTELMTSYPSKNTCDLFIRLYEKYGLSFVKELRGNFCGVFYNTKNKKLIVYNNIFSLKPVYYYFDKKHCIFGSSVFNIAKILCKLNIRYTQSIPGAYCLLTFGHMIDDVTLVNEIKKLPPASTLEVNTDEKHCLSMQVHQYYVYDNTVFHNQPVRQLVSELHDRFRHAVKLSFDKDVEYGKKHLGLLSGGLDSRIIAFCAKSLGYKQMQLLTFSQSNSLDEKIARKIARFLHFDFLMYQLDGGDYLKQLSEVVQINSGHIFFPGAAHQYTAVSKINNEAFGLLHNGNLADVMQGDYTTAWHHKSVNINQWVISSKLLFRLSDFVKPVILKYPNEEHFAINNNGINAITNGNIMSYEFFETAEPYLDYDVVHYASKIPPEYKYREKLFLMMIERYYPEATAFTWEKWRMRPTMRNLSIRKSIAYRVYMKFYRKCLQLTTASYSMNPFDYWYKSNSDLRQFLTNCYKDTIIGIVDNNLKKDCENLFTAGNVLEKHLVLTYLEAVRNLCFR